MSTTWRLSGKWMLLGLAMVFGASAALAADSEAPAAKAKAPFIVHEWGTFTTLNDDTGKQLPGINIDDEPVPKFVHNLAPYLLNNPVLSNEHWIYRQKGAPRQHPMVTMRLETPVLYFYPGADGKLPATVDVDVKFRGGWLTEFYPFATSMWADEASAEALNPNGPFDFGALTPSMTGRLTWRDVRLDTRTRGPETDEQVWLAPRNVRSVDVSVQNPMAKGQAQTESERYLFYRGVANQQAPLRVSTDREKREISVRANFDEVLRRDTDARIDAAWLVDIRSDGRTAFRALNGFTVNSDREKVVSTASTNFSEGDYATGNLDQLKQTMHKALVADGLYKDEAAAMLATWQRAYFKTAGTRLFYLVPQVWTDHYLPLSVTGGPSIDRVMMGRSELISTEQRMFLKKMTDGPVSDSRWINDIPQGPAKEQFLSGRSNFGNLGVKIPADYQTYLDLGRFRNALVIAEHKRTASPTLAKFVNSYGLQPYRWAEK